jgi:hypothetical protein
MSYGHSLWGCELEHTGSELSLLLEPCECNYETSGSSEGGKFLDQVSNYWITIVPNVLYVVSPKSAHT